MLTKLVISIVAYLLGSIPFGLILVRIFRREDIRTLGSGNIGATNVVRSGAKGLGAATFVLDAVKGYAAVYFAGIVMHGSSHGIPALQNAEALAALCATLGQMFPVWLGFKGGKGVATAFGVFLAITPLSAFAALAVFTVAVLISKYVSVASLLAAVTVPVCAFLVFPTERTWLSSAVIVIIPLLVIAKHRKNIERLIKGSEYRFGRTKPVTT
jgi:acyl phosphate:glycerol-3-phosphate acyltransferase